MFPGTSSTGGGLFGTTAQPSISTNQNSGSLFGTPGQGPTSSNTSSLFGTPSQGSTGGGLFGSSSQTKDGSNIGGSFGSTSTGAGGISFGSQAGQSLFGQPSTSSTSSNLFANQNPGSTSSGLFGSSSGFGTGSQNTGLFGGGGSSTSSNLFGGPSATKNPSGSHFGVGPFGSTQPGFGTSNQQAATANTQPFSFTSSMYSAPPATAGISSAGLSLAPWWYRELVTLAAAYEPFGQANRFQTMLYEVIGVAPDLLRIPGAVAPMHIDYVKAQRKAEIFQRLPWLDQREWQQAEQKNPDPSNLMPTPIIGIDALYERVGQQMSHVRTQLQMLKNTEPPFQQPQQGEMDKPGSSQLAIVAVSEKDNKNAGTSTVQLPWIGFDPSDMFEEKIEYCKHEHIRLTHRLTKVLGRLERLQSFGTKRNKEEIEFEKRLDKVRKTLDDPRGCKATLAELEAQLKVEDIMQATNNEETQRSFEITEAQQKAIFEFMNFQREGLAQLMQVVKKDMRDLQIIQNRLTPYLPN